MKNFLFISKKNSWSDFLFNQVKKIENTIWKSIITEYDRDNLLTLKDFIGRINPEKIFFFHWSNYIPKEIFEKYECISFHTSNLPDGRGGSPLQNQILNNVVQTAVNAIRTSENFDKGDLYCREVISLQGNLDDIWHTIATVAFGMIENIIKEDIKPVPQETKLNPVIYKRLKNNSLDFENKDSIYSVYRHIQMLDAEGYENAYIIIGNFRLDLSRAKINNENEIIADVRIKKFI